MATHGQLAAARHCVRSILYGSIQHSRGQHPECAIATQHDGHGHGLVRTRSTDSMPPNVPRIISSGSWAYALTAPWTGQWTDRMGGHNGMLVACVGAGLCNLILGCLFVTSTSSQVPFMVLFASNVALQGYGTSAVVKINAMWYSPSERGIFSGVFNIFVASGYYLALGSGHSIISSLGWSYLFFIPATLLLIMSAVVVTCVANTPPPTANVPSILKGAEGTSAPARQQPSIWALLHNRTLLGYLAAVFCLSWARDGLLNWMYSFFDSVRAVPLTEDDHAILGGAWTVGGFVGGLLCGYISDIMFESNRMPPIVLFSTFQAGAFLFMYTLAPSISTPFLGLLVFFVSVFVLGNYTLLSYTVPADLPANISASAVGLFTAVGYISTGLAGVVMGSCIQRWGYTFWVTSLTASSVATALCTMLGSYFSELDEAVDEAAPLRQRRKSRASIVGSDVLVLPPDDDDCGNDGAVQAL
ncbi:hypothetical protein, variant 3 [Aphanomyces invadans]|uniref:Major facilitator superfamily (MFS) profile domain-containing protein n=2 Tax=Aphanomyces invadans TaxID=157072 RepID=A0A024UMU8_9STRA|nr:hypothetical protein, variant 2 [Aphanomyces invadans]XP_008864983.1 hypothetical protein, variant 3 [Aphanomyces invadans]ETW06907.1 hypothetical protein, variant 2 [Aphanomyces invadans]ETW06908.1 hypothetical protein, variant 3 [Aphanomyces invadans]|eukprot:XP_008864982.1 hypothetical protein, variant 2 [Aphanomyces invadans]